MNPISAGPKDPAKSAAGPVKYAPIPSTAEFPFDVTVGGYPQFFVNNYDLNAWCTGCFDAAGRTGILQVGIQGKRQEIGKDLRDEFQYQNSKATLNVFRDDSKVTVWASSNTVLIPAPTPRDLSHFHDSRANVGLQFSIPPNRYGTQTMGVDIRPNFACQRPNTYAGAVFGEDYAFTSFNGRAQSFKQYFTRATHGTINISVGGELTGFEQVTGRCIMAVKITFLDNPPPE